MSRRLVPLVASSAAFAYFYLVSEYPWQLAFLSGLAFGALAFVVRRTVIQMRGLLASEGGSESSEAGD